MIKLIASDIDGTLIPIGGRMSERTKNAVKSCARRGILFVPASGRSYDGASRVFRDMDLNVCVISANGGRADAHTTHESPIFEDRIDGETSIKICERLLDAGCFMTSYVGTDVYMLPETNGYGSTCANISEVSHIYKADASELRRQMRAKGVNCPYKFEAYSDDAALLKRLKEEFVSWGLSVSGAFSFNLEIMAPGAGKGRALEHVARLHGISKNEIMALGDGTNDITLLKASGLPIAMSNSAEELRSAAKIIAPPANEDGAAAMLEKYVLSETYA